MLKQSFDVARVELDGVVASIEDRRRELVIRVKGFMGRSVSVHRFILVDVVNCCFGLVSASRVLEPDSRWREYGR